MPEHTLITSEPHAGHLYTLILTDVLKRWQLLKGDRNATLLTGTDEHGMKIQKAATKAHTDAKAFCDRHARQFLQLADAANVSYDRFIRTTDQDHIDAVDFFWRELNRRGYLYESKHEGWYSVSDETFYPESQVHLVLEPSSGRKMHASIETGKEVEWTSETNYHFRMSDFKDRLLQHYKENPTFIVPNSRMNFIIKEVESGLQDLSVSRPTSRLSWGIRVPDDESQTIYVWLDALINYLTFTGYPSPASGTKPPFWPPDVQVIGKDIIRFHCIYWPAFLMALDLPLPKKFLTHAHWTMGREKMSKSLGNGVNPFMAMKNYGVDTIRYFLTHDGGIADDADYDNSYIVERYKKGLQGGIGNLASRIIRGKKWSVPAAVETFAAEQKLFLPDNLQKIGSELRQALENIASESDLLMEQANPRQALRNIMEVVYSTNKFFHEAGGWNMVKSEDPVTQKALQSVIFLSAESVRICIILLQPFMPGRMQLALDWFGVEESRRSLEYAKFGADLLYGKPFQDPGKPGVENTLFPPLASQF